MVPHSATVKRAGTRLPSLHASSGCSCLSSCQLLLKTPSKAFQCKLPAIGLLTVQPQPSSASGIEGTLRPASCTIETNHILFFRNGHKPRRIIDPDDEQFGLVNDEPQLEAQQACNKCQPHQTTNCSSLGWHDAMAFAGVVKRTCCELCP